MQLNRRTKRQCKERGRKDEDVKLTNQEVNLVKNGRMLNDRHIDAANQENSGDRLWQGGTNYGDYRWSGGNIYSGPGGPLVSTTDGPGGPLIGGTIHSMTGLLFCSQISLPVATA